MEIADFFQGACERVGAGGVLMASLPKAEHDGRRTPLLRKVAQVPEKHRADQEISGFSLVRPNFTC